ncbi:MAG: ATP-binding protein, partial [Anaerolineales bacterium]
TRLAREFLGWARAQGALVLAGRAFEIGGRLPYQPLVEALRSSMSASVWGRTPILSPTWLAELSRLLPELSDQIPDLPAPLMLGEAEARPRLFEAVARLGQALAARAPLVIFVDDVHWADAASLDLLAYVGRRWAATNLPALLLVTARSEDLPAVNDWLAGLERDATLTRLALNPLTREDTLALAKLLRVGNWGLEIGEEDFQSLISNLYSETGGHPLFIVETLRSLREQGELSGPPPGVREVIRNRLARLSASAHGVCSAAAVLGSSFTFRPLCQVADLDEREGLPALEELLARGLLREAGPRNDSRIAPTLVFAHDKIREVAYAEISEARRQVFHHRALEALAAEAAPPAELARHALAAGLAGRTFHLLVAAGDEAMRMFAAR